MRIVQVTAFHVRIPLKKPVVHASFAREENETLIVRCRLDDGSEGWGEGLPRAYVTGETIDSCFSHLRSIDWTSQLSEPIEDVTSAIAQCDAFELPAVEGASQRDCFGNVVRCAVELSILDAATRALGVPLSSVTEQLPETMGIREQREEVRYSGVITSMTPFKRVVRAFGMRLFGFPDIKVKVGMPGVDDAASLASIRRMVGRELNLRIDANEAWTCDNLEEKLNLLIPYRISSVEQPVPHAEVEGLGRVRKNLSVPIMLDESLCSLADGHRAIEQGTCDLFNLRLSKCGGFLNTLRLAALAHRAGLGYQLGCQVGETGILSAAGRHFACSVAGIRHLEGSYERFLVRERLTAEDLTFHAGGRAPALTGPGLGVSIDPAALERVTVKTENWMIS